MLFRLKIVAGPGLVLDGSKLSLPLTCATGNVLKWNGVTGAWECNPDLNNQYAAGTGLKLDAATFSVDQSVVTGWAKAACFDTNDEVLAVVAAGGYLNKSDKLVESQMPANGLNEISNGLISDQFVDVVASLTTPVKIKDNNPIGVSDEIVFPDIGIAENLTINVDITTSNITQDKVYLYDPNNVEYVLHLPTYDPNSKATSLKTSFPVPTAPVSGNLASWIGKNPVGTWRLKVIDTTFLNNEFDGQITSWSITLQTLSTKKIQVDGDAYFNKNVYMAKDLTVNGMTTLKGGLTVTGSVTATIGGTISFTNAEGTAPFTVASTTKVDKLNADLLDGYNSSNFMGGMTYTHWGATTCGTGWSAVSTGT